VKILDISWPINGQMTAYKDKQFVQIHAIKTWQDQQVRESLLTLTTHTGTHIDAPSHFIEQGATNETIVLETLCGPCSVIDCTDVEIITRHTLEHVNLQPGMRILFKTRNSMRADDARFDQSFVYIDSSAAQYLVQYNVSVVGIDYLGIERNQVGHPTHHTFLNAGIVIIEGLRLGQIQEGKYTLFCLPLAYQGLDGAPARAILIE
jgi:arylformamidase